MIARSLVALALLLVGCGTVPVETAEPEYDGPRPVLEVLGGEPVEGGVRLRVRLSNPTGLTWCHLAVQDRPVLRLQLPSGDGTSWEDESNSMFCGTGETWIELGPGDCVETTVLVDSPPERMRLSLSLTEGVLQPREGYHFLWPPMNQPDLRVHSEPIAITAERTPR